MYIRVERNRNIQKYENATLLQIISDEKLVRATSFRVIIEKSLECGIFHQVSQLVCLTNYSPPPFLSNLIKLQYVALYKLKTGNWSHFSTFCPFPTISTVFHTQDSG